MFRASLLATITLAAVGAPASADRACDAACQLYRGTPLRLSDAVVVWVRRCDTVDAKRSCVLEKRDLIMDRGVRSTIPMDDDSGAFGRKHLKKTSVSVLDTAVPWPDLSQRIVFNLDTTGVEMSIEGGKLGCRRSNAAHSQNSVELGCKPTTVEVRVEKLRGGDGPRSLSGIAVATATCASESESHEVVLVCG